MMITVVGQTVEQRPPVKLASHWNNSGLVLAHRNGLVSVFNDKTLIASIQTLDQRIVHLRAIEKSLYISFESGLFVCYSLPLGILQQQVQLPGPVDGIYLQESTVVVWGTATRVLFLNRFSLDIMRTLEFDSKPVRVCKDKYLAVVLRSGQIHWIDGPEEVHLPLDQGKFGPLIDAACVGVGKWVCIQRDKWSIVQELDGEFHLEFNASAPDLLQSLYVSTSTSTFAVTCDSGQLLVVEGNNIQVLEPQWPAYALKGLVYDDNIPLAILENGIYRGEIQDMVWNWHKVEFPSTTNENVWVIDGKYTANECEFGTLDENCEFSLIYTAPAPVTSFLVAGEKIHLGLANGSIICDGQETKAIASAVKFICKSDILVVAGEHSVALLFDLPVILPIDACIHNICLEGDLLGVETENGIQAYNIKTFEPTNKSVSIAPVPYTKTYEPFISGHTGPLVGFSVAKSVSLFSSQPTKDTAAAIYTIKCTHGMSIQEADDQLRAMGISAEHFEKLLVLLNSQNPELCSTAITLLQSLTDNKRIESLMKQGGIGPTLLFSAVYPNIPVGDWLSESIKQLLAGNVTEKLVGLQVLSHHTELHKFPFQQLENIGITSAVERFTIGAIKSNEAGFTKAICDALDSKDLKYFTLCIECITYTMPVLGIDNANFVRLIGAASRAVHRTPAGMSSVRKLFACLLSRYPYQVLFNKERQILFLKSTGAGSQMCGVLWELQSGRQFTLAGSAGGIFKFTEDGKSIECEATTWRLPGAIASLFGNTSVIQPVNS